MAFSGQKSLHASHETHRELIVNSILILLLYGKFEIYK